MSILPLEANLAIFMAYGALGFSIFLIVLLSFAKEFKTRRAAITALFVLVMLTGYISFTDLLSRPKPVDIMTWDKPEAESAVVVGSYLIEKKAIYLLLLLEGEKEPRYYRYPWSKQMAEQLIQQQQDNRGNPIIMNFPFEWSWENREVPFFHPMPWPKAPQKEERKRDVIDLDQLAGGPVKSDVI